MANFNIELDHSLILKRHEEDPALFKIQLDGLEATVEFVSNGGGALKKNRERIWSRTFSHMVITISRPDTPPPKVIPKKNGSRDYSVQTEYFKERSPLFEKAAVEIANRAIQFFMYRLWQPLLSEIDANNHHIKNPIWTDEKGNEVGKGTGVFVVSAVPSFHMGNFGTIFFQKSHERSFQRHLTNPRPPSLLNEILYDAQSAIYVGNYRRAVLELAVSVELSVKQSIFGTKSSSGITFEYLEDKGRINVRVIELIDKIALQVFGASFKDINPVNYKHIDHLFRCRNKVAHRGVAEYKDDSGVLHQVDKETLIDWWDASTCLLKWLKSL